MAPSLPIDMPGRAPEAISISHDETRRFDTTALAGAPRYLAFEVADTGPHLDFPEPPRLTAAADKPQTRVGHRATSAEPTRGMGGVTFCERALVGQPTHVDVGDKIVDERDDAASFRTDHVVGPD